MELKGFTLNNEERDMLIKYSLYDEFIELCQKKEDTEKILEIYMEKSNTTEDLKLSLLYFNVVEECHERMSRLIKAVYNCKRKAVKLCYEQKTKAIEELIKLLEKNN